jgi:pyruvate/oxaloacetate carboxyltransferase
VTRKIEFVDCSLRDGHQSLLATRMSTPQVMRVLPLLKEAGFRELELWGGATLDSCIRFLDEDPWERLDRCAETLGHGVHIRALCRGQNLFAYSPYPDNLVVSFVKEAIRSGLTKMRIFDALNDSRNLTVATMATKTWNGVAEGALSYTTSPVHSVEYFLAFAKQLEDDGVDCLAIKDMAGLLHPHVAARLVKGLKAQSALEVNFHSHCTNGLAVTAAVAAMMAGVDRIDTAFGPMAGATSQPPIEVLAWFADELGFEVVPPGRDLFPRISDELRQIRAELARFDKYAGALPAALPAHAPDIMRARVATAAELIEEGTEGSMEKAMTIIETEILAHYHYPAAEKGQLDAQVPGGMISNLYNQLKEVGQLESLPRILEEIARVRRDAGYVPLVTPTSQIVGSQAAFNVTAGTPYKITSQEFRDLILGKYGRTPAPVDPALVKRICGPGTEPLHYRPGHYLPPVDVVRDVAAKTKFAKTVRDQLLFLLFPGPAEKLLAARAPSPS